MTRAERAQATVIRWILRRVPLWVAEAPERVLINVACALVGLATLAYGPADGSLLALWPWWLTAGWGLAMITGGIAILVGIRLSSQWRYALSMERVGYLLLMPACLIYGTALIVVFGWRGVIVGAIFLGIAAAKGLRLLVTSAARTAVLQQADREDAE